MSKNNHPGAERAPAGQKVAHAAAAIACVADHALIPLSRDAVTELSDVVAHGVRYVLNHFASEVTLDGMAEAAGLSKFHFLRKFSQEVGVPPGEFLQRFRIAQAMQRLVNSEEAIEEIARTVGYSSPASFSRAFARVAGMQPRQYRRRGQRKRSRGGRRKRAQRTLAAAVEASPDGAA